MKNFKEIIRVFEESDDDHIETWLLNELNGSPNEPLSQWHPYRLAEEFLNYILKDCKYDFVTKQIINLKTKERTNFNGIKLFVSELCVCTNKKLVPKITHLKLFFNSWCKDNTYEEPEDPTKKGKIPIYEDYLTVTIEDVVYFLDKNFRKTKNIVKEQKTGWLKHHFEQYFGYMFKETLETCLLLAGFKVDHKHQTNVSEVDMKKLDNCGLNHKDIRDKKYGNQEPNHHNRYEERLNMVKDMIKKGYSQKEMLELLFIAEVTEI